MSAVSKSLHLCRTLVSSRCLVWVSNRAASKIASDLSVFSCKFNRLWDHRLGNAKSWWKEVRKERSWSGHFLRTKSADQQFFSFLLAALFISFRRTHWRIRDAGDEERRRSAAVELWRESLIRPPVEKYVPKSLDRRKKAIATCIFFLCSYLSVRFLMLLS